MLFVSVRDSPTSAAVHTGTPHRSRVFMQIAFRTLPTWHIVCKVCDVRHSKHLFNRIVSYTLLKWYNIKNYAAIDVVLWVDLDLELACNGMFISNGSRCSGNHRMEIYFLCASKQHFVQLFCTLTIWKKKKHL